MLLVLYCNYTECASITHVYYSFSSLLSPLLGCRDSDWCHQFCYLMFTLLIVKHFENWINGLGKWANQNSYVMFTIEKTAVPNLLLVFVIGIFLLISCYCLVRYGRKAFIHDESGASGRRIVSPNNYEMSLQTNPHGIRFIRGLMNKPRSSIWFTNKCKNYLLVNGLRFVFLT